MKRFKSIFTLVLAAVFILGFSVASFILPDKDILVAENRTSPKFPEVTKQTVLDGSFMTDFEKYTLDHFPLRDAFRKLKSHVVLDVLLQKENNGYFMQDGYIFKNPSEINFELIDKNMARIRFYYQNLLQGAGKVYFSLIPDKGYYNPDKLALMADYDALFGRILGSVDYAEYIDITDALSIDSYYATDTHWRQEKILNVAQHLLDGMGAENSLGNTSVVSTGSYFDGIYARQTFFDTNGDLMNYVTSPLLDSAVLTDNTVEQTVPIYNTDKINSDEPYDMFMSGAKMGMVTLQRSENTTGKTLVVFRDSFGSSIGPLLLGGYDKVIFLDTRQIMPIAIKGMVDFTDCDVLFLYSTTVLSETDEFK